jgi:SAM-dependent methyltransferase
MLAPRLLPEPYRRWNRKWGAPGGRRFVRLAPKAFSRGRWVFPPLFGPFVFQPNNETRVFEYPWAFHAVDVGGRDVVEIGGSLSGFQFVLSRCGARVRNVDPGTDAPGRGWRVDDAHIARLNRWFRTSVELVPSTLQAADLEAESTDVVYSISTLEHIPAPELPSLAQHIRRVLRPGGHLVATVDLFLNLAPFTSRHENEYGTNLDVREFVTATGLTMTQGKHEELCGYDEFDPDRVLRNLERYLVGAYPAAAQLFVLRKV